MKSFTLISTFSVILPIIAGLALGRIQDIKLKGLLSFLFFTLVIETIATYFVFHRKPTYRLYDFYILVEYCFYAWFYSSLVKNHLLKRIFLYSIIPYLISAILYILFYHPTGYSTQLNMVESILIFSLVLSYFYDLITADVFIDLKREPFFWISIGLLLYFAGSFFEQGSYNYATTHPELRSIEESIHLISNIFLHLFITLGFLLKKSRQVA